MTCPAFGICGRRTHTRVDNRELLWLQQMLRIYRQCQIGIGQDYRRVALSPGWSSILDGNQTLQVEPGQECLGEDNIDERQGTDSAPTAIYLPAVPMRVYWASTACQRLSRLTYIRVYRESPPTSRSPRWPSLVVRPTTTAVVPYTRTVISECSIRAYRKTPRRTSAIISDLVDTVPMFGIAV
jgi:hypothetical protein